MWPFVSGFSSLLSSTSGLVSVTACEGVEVAGLRMIIKALKRILQRKALGLSLPECCLGGPSLGLGFTVSRGQCKGPHVSWGLGIWPVCTGQTRAHQCHRNNLGSNMSHRAMAVSYQMFERLFTALKMPPRLITAVGRKGK